MRLTLAHGGIPCHWNGPWVYLGSSYNKMLEWERNLSGDRISLAVELRHEVEAKRPVFIEWINKQRQANGDSLHWWMTTIAGRNNMVSMLFLSLCQITVLREWLRQRSNDCSELLVVCEDGFLLQAVYENLADETHVRRNLSWRLRLLLDWGGLLGRAVISYVRDILWFWYHARAARVTRQKLWSRPVGEIFLIHQPLDDKAFREDGQIVDRYFSVLPKWLEDRGYHVVRLPWLYNISLPLEKVYRQLRSAGCLIPEDWLNLSDYALALWNRSKSAFTLRYDVPFPNIEIGALISRERLQQLGNRGGILWCYAPVLRRWGKQLDSLTVVDVFEGMLPEHILVSEMRSNLLKDAYSIGYYHSLVTKDFLAYHFTSSEWDSKVMPDRIVTNGPLARDVLIRQGIPASRVVAGPALRLQYPGRQLVKPDGQTLLILLSLDMDANLEVLDAIAQHASWVRKVLQVTVVIKPHPMMRADKLMRKLNWNGLPEGWCWFAGEIADALQNAHCCVVMSSSGAYDAVVADCVVIALERELGLMGNYLDLLEDEFPIVRAIPKNSLKNKLQDIFVLQRSNYLDEFERVRERLLNGINPVTDKHLRMFLRNQSEFRDEHSV
jgi:hypothetical protein